MGLASGTQIGPYEIAALLGAGGMGEVYRAVDTRLGRQVAIKVLVASGHDSDRLRRFEVETRTVSSLQHANILALYDVGNFQERPFLVSELLQGETLRDLLHRSPLQPAKAVDLAIQLCHGLAAAHDKGIVHRDIKPENLFITRDGILKILDFGIAKRTAAETSRSLEKPVTVTEKTETGTVLGTAGYMSPEQVRGQTADRRSDLFSAGAVLYEMLTGQRAFQRDSTLETAYAIVKDQPQELPSSVAPALAQVVQRCLEKQPDDRFQSARDLGAALEQWRFASQGPGSAERSQGLGSAERASSSDAPGEARQQSSERRAEMGTAPGQVLSPVPPGRAEAAPATLLRRAARVLLMAVVVAVAGAGSWVGWHRYQQAASPSRIMMAVLPFEDFSGDSQKEYFAEGLTEGMISQLGRIQPERLAVIARTSVAQYRHTKKSVNEIARELGVQYVLECSVLHVDDHMRVDARLIQAIDQTQIWAETYEREVKDVMQLQSDVARAIAGQVRIKLGAEQSAGLSRTRSLNPAAYDAYLRGRHFKDKSSPEGIRQAIFYFEQATKLDPGYAQAYASLAMVTAVQPAFSPVREADTGPLAKAAVHRALELDDGLAVAHAAFAVIILLYDWDWAGAERHYRRALELDPNDFDARRSYAFNYLGSLGRHDEAIAEFTRARELAPVSLQINWMLGSAYFAAGQHDRAIDQLKRTIELDPGAPMPHWYLALVYDAKGMYREALAEFEKIGVTAASDDQGDIMAIGQVYAHAGNQGEALKALQRMETLARAEKPSLESFAALNVALHRPDEAFAWLEEAYKERRQWLIGLRSAREWAPLRKDPRFADLARRIGIPELSQRQR